MAKKNVLGVMTPFKDSTGEIIRVHNYVKDSKGNCYVINSRHLAVPMGDDPNAAAYTLESLMQQGPVTIMSSEEVLAVNYVSGRPKAANASNGVQAEKKADKETAASPVDMGIVLSSISEVALVAELRRRGYYVTAVKPALIQL